ncbi:hypothetical protein [Paraburkholderia caffeinilytica]|jgi:hypothetical protein|uniref:hypothetical protein n=1 Tax=Paraburkholderia caffeinilytica TaxID=1761016 RepID=UPI0013BEA1D3|nr:hypothetical protein [Paraburkholderia caffeinilytica]
MAVGETETADPEIGIVFPGISPKRHSDWFDNNAANQKHPKRAYEKITHFSNP